MTAHHLVDASAACLVALAALWCAASPLHWAVRWGVVTAIVLTSLLAAAFEPVIQYTAAVLLISAGVAIYRWRSNRSTGAATFPKFRVSLRDLLLLTAFASVAMAVVSRMPKFSLSGFMGNVGVGVSIASACLLALWIVYGRAPWRRRLFFGGLTVAGLLLLFFNHYGLWLWMTGQSYGVQQNSLQSWAAWWYTPDNFSWWFWEMGLTGLLGLSLLCLVLKAAKESGWFGSDGQSLRTTSWRRRLGQAGLVAPVSLMTLLMAAVLWELTHPLRDPSRAPGPRSKRLGRISRRGRDDLGKGLLPFGRHRHDDRRPGRR